MIKKIFHLADLHIPNSVEKRPYDDMLKKMLSELYKEIKKCNKDEVRILVAGDIFQNKIRTSNEARKMFHEVLNYLNAMAKTIIIAGNHDMLENNHDKIDSISPTFDIMGVYPDITYADKVLNYKSGYIKDDNVVWAIYSIYDKFIKPNIEGLKNENKDCKIIGVFHGEISGASTDSGYISEKGINTDIFNDCDYVMAGHIHKYQQIKHNGVPIVYSGSVIQQDCGENTTGHGFVIWDLENNKHTFHEVPNNYKIYKFSISSYEDVENDNEKLLNL